MKPLLAPLPVATFGNLPPRILMLPAFSPNPYRMPDGRGRVFVYVATGRGNRASGMRQFKFKRSESTP